LVGKKNENEINLFSVPSYFFNQTMAKEKSSIYVMRFSLVISVCVFEILFSFEA